MKVIRTTIICTLLTCTALALVVIRLERTQCIARIQALRLTQLRLSEKLTAQQLQIARLRSPSHIADRVERLNLHVAAPDAIPKTQDTLAMTEPGNREHQ